MITVYIFISFCCLHWPSPMQLFPHVLKQKKIFFCCCFSLLHLFNEYMRHSADLCALWPLAAVHLTPWFHNYLLCHLMLTLNWIPGCFLVFQPNGGDDDGINQIDLHPFSVPENTPYIAIVGPFLFIFMLHFHKPDVFTSAVFLSWCCSSVLFTPSSCVFSSSPFSSSSSQYLFKIPITLDYFIPDHTLQCSLEGATCLEISVSPQPAIS